MNACGHTKSDPDGRALRPGLREKGSVAHAIVRLAHIKNFHRNRCATSLIFDRSRLRRWTRMLCEPLAGSSHRVRRHRVRRHRHREGHRGRNYS